MTIINKTKTPMDETQTLKENNIKFDDNWRK